MEDSLRFGFRVVLLFVLGFVTFDALGAAGDRDAKVDQVMANADARHRAAQAGQRAAFFCENCHGATGNSELPHVPNLAGQNPVYLLTQIDKFGDGRRKDEFMSGLVRVLKPEDRFNIAVFYATQAVVPTMVKDKRLLEAGRSHYKRACFGCHGAEAKGGRDIARMAGQHSVYLTNALKDYRTGRGVRSDVRMTSVAKHLTDEQIDALAGYLSSLN